MEGWEEELEKLVDLSSEEIASKLGISNEAADHVHDAIADYLDSDPACEGDPEEEEVAEEGD